VKVLDNMLYSQTSLDGIYDERLSVIRGDVTNINDIVGAVEGVDSVVFLAEVVCYVCVCVWCVCMCVVLYVCV